MTIRALDRPIPSGRHRERRIGTIDKTVFRPTFSAPVTGHVMTAFRILFVGILALCLGTQQAMCACQHDDPMLPAHQMAASVDMNMGADKPCSDHAPEPEATNHHCEWCDTALTASTATDPAFAAAPTSIKLATLARSAPRFEAGLRNTAPQPHLIWPPPPIRQTPIALKTRLLN